jgi:hypothetical protein
MGRVIRVGRLRSTFTERATKLAPRLNSRRSTTPEEAGDQFGWFAHFAALDNPTSSQAIRELLGWQPKQPGLIADLDNPHYFDI